VKTWTDGDMETYYGTDYKQKVFAGLFWYHAFGSGEFFAPDGTVHDCTTTESHKLAERYKVEWRMVDSFSCYVPTALGDR
jgi:hypothetical protein